MLVQDETASVRAARQSEEARLRLQALFDHSVDAILLLEAAGRILDVNPTAARLFGLEREALLQRALWEVVPRLSQANLHGWWQSFTAAGQDEGIFSAENIHGDFHSMQYRVVANILPGVHLLVLHDITVSTQAQEKLRETEELLRNILDHAPMPIFVVTPDRRIRLANRAWIKMLGPFQPDMPVADLADRVSEEALRKLMDVNDQVFESSAPVECEELLDYGGEVHTFYTVKFPLRDASGAVEAVGGISIDISAMKAAEVVLRESEIKFRNLVEQSQDGIILSDEEGRVIEWNHAQETITGIPAQEALGQFVWDLQFSLAPEQDRTEKNYARLKQNQLLVLQTGSSPWLEGLWETGLRRRDGTVVRVQSSVFLIRTQRGFMVGSITREVTRERQIQEEVNQRNRELTSLLQISQQISGQLDLEQLLRSVSDVIVNTLPGADYAAVWLYDEARSCLRVRSCSGDLGRKMEGVEVPGAGNLVARILHSQEPVTVVAVIPTENGFPAHPGSLSVMRSLLGVPLLLEGKPVGVVTVANFRQEGAFSAQDSRWLQSLAGQVVVMVANARLFEQVSSSQARLQALSRRLVEIQEEERRRIARELHDEVGQILTGLKLLLRMTAQSGGQAALQNLKEAQELTNDLLNLVHDMSLDLRPAMLDDLGLLPALFWQIDRFHHQTGIEVDFRHYGLEGVRFPVEMETAAFRITQEALTNVARHAGVNSVEVRVWANLRELGLQVEDRGAGFDTREVVNSTAGLGLNGIRERAALLGGQVTVQSDTGKGTRIRAIFPLKSSTQEAGQEP